MNKLCQSCAMPMESDDMYGLEKDGKKSSDYCKFCYIDGEFNTINGKVTTMEEMIEICIPHTLKAMPEMDEEQVRTMMNEFFPTLKRWKQT